MIALESVPEILRIPDKLYPLIVRFNEKRYFLLEGGRGGGKTQSIGRFILYLADKHPLRIVCGRETQNSINESVYAVLRDLIIAHNLDFEVQAAKIISRTTGATIAFRGFREQGAFNLQGLEGIDICWVDEAQAVTKRTLDILIPTIRKDRAKIFFTMNRHLPGDPVYSTFVGRDDCLHIPINYNENPFCTEALKKEAVECRRLSPKDYAHIWLGQPLDQTEDSLFSVSELDEARRRDFPLQLGFGERVAGFDIARFGEDKNACIILEQRDHHGWQMVFKTQWGKSDLNFTTGKILELTKANSVGFAAIDEDGLGSGPLDTLQRGHNLDYFKGFRNTSISTDDNRDFANQRTKWAYKLKDLVVNGRIAIPDDEIISELLSLRYTFKADQRRILVSKDKMREQGVKSPNLADALIYATSLLSDVKEKQDAKYEPKQPTYSNQPWNPF